LQPKTPSAWTSCCFGLKGAPSSSLSSIYLKVFTFLYLPQSLHPHASISVRKGKNKIFYHFLNFWTKIFFTFSWIGNRSNFNFVSLYSYTWSDLFFFSHLHSLYWICLNMSSITKAIKGSVHWTFSPLYGTPIALFSNAESLL